MSEHDRIPPGEFGDPDPAGADAALRRAGERARREAAAAGQAVVVFEDGEIVWETPGREYLPQERNADDDGTPASAGAGRALAHPEQPSRLLLRQPS